VARWDEATLRRIREATDLVALAGETVRLRRSGRRWVGLCPFHEERTPSFGISPDKGLFYCFGCGAGGDAFAFVMRREGLTFPEAVRYLAERAGIPLQEDPQEREQRRQQERFLRALEVAQRLYRQALVQHEEAAVARAYLSRREVPPEVQEAFGLGYAPRDAEPLRRALREAGISPGEAAQAGLAWGPQGEDRLAGRLILPIRDERGRVVGLGARALRDDLQPRYWNTPESPWFQKRRLLYGFDLARDHARQRGEVVVVEGYFDVLAMVAAGIAHTVGTMGTAVSPEHLGRLGRLAGRVTILFDGDEAGERATQRALLMCQRLGIPARGARLQGGKDPDEVRRTLGPQVLYEAVRQAQPLPLYLLQQAQAKGLLAGAESRSQVAQEVVRVLAGEPSAVAQAAYVREAARLLEVPEAVLWQDLRRAQRQVHPARQAPPAHSAKGDGNAKSLRPKDAAGRREEELAALILNDPSLGKRLAIVPEAFSDPQLAQLVEAAMQGRGIDLLPGPLQARAAALAVRSGQHVDPEASALDMWRRLQEDRRRRERKAQVARLRALEQAGDAVPEDMLRSIRVRREVTADGPQGDDGHGPLPR
jgi:DNA primase